MYIWMWVSKDGYTCFASPPIKRWGLIPFPVYWNGLSHLFDQWEAVDFKDSEMSRLRSLEFDILYPGLLGCLLELDRRKKRKLPPTKTPDYPETTRLWSQAVKRLKLDMWRGHVEAEWVAVPDVPENQLGSRLRVETISNISSLGHMKLKGTKESLC